jgi:hypothetical protein
MSATPDYAFPVGCTTIDKDGDDVGALPCARSTLPSGEGHSTTEQAVAALLACAREKRAPVQANIIGHGIPGRINTGAGKSQDTDEARYIGRTNYSTWKPLLAQLKNNIESLVLWGCDVGEGPEGLELLTQIVDVVKVTVAAPAEVLNCRGANGFALYGQGRWLTVTPDGLPPDMILTPDYVRHAKRKKKGIETEAVPDGLWRAYEDEEPSTIVVPVDGEDEEIFTYQVDSVVCYEAESQQPLKTLDRLAIDSIPQLIDFEHAVNVGGPLLAVKTGRLKVEFSRGGQSFRASFDVYNDRFVHDPASGAFVYRRAKRGLMKRLLDQ